MKMIYIDSDFKCHVSNDGTLRAVTSPFFEGKCDEFIEGYRYIPEGELWTNEKGKTFLGEMISPWKSYKELENAQREYESQRLLEYIEALKIIGASE